MLGLGLALIPALPESNDDRFEAFMLGHSVLEGALVVEQAVTVCGTVLLLTHVTVVPEETLKGLGKSQFVAVEQVPLGVSNMVTCWVGPPPPPPR